MGKNTINLILLALLLCVGLVGANYSFLYWKRARELRQLQFQGATLNQQQNLIKALAAESLEYSKKNPAIDPILQSVGVKPGAAATSKAK